jgi:hypothetical protein
MVLKLGTIDGYNNKLIIATEDIKPGLFNVNNAILSHKASPLSGKPDKVNRVGKSTNPAKHQFSIAHRVSNEPDNVNWVGKGTNPAKHEVSIAHSVSNDSSFNETSMAHENNKRRLAIGFGLVIGLGVVYFKR